MHTPSTATKRYGKVTNSLIYEFEYETDLQNTQLRTQTDECKTQWKQTRQNSVFAGRKKKRNRYVSTFVGILKFEIWNLNRLLHFIEAEILEFEDRSALFDEYDEIFRERIENAHNSRFSGLSSNNKTRWNSDLDSDDGSHRKSSFMQASNASESVFFVAGAIITTWTTPGDTSFVII